MKKTITFWKIKKNLLLVGTVMLLGLGSTLTVAFSVAQSEWVRNTFLQAELNTEIEEHLDVANWVKEVRVVNKGKSPAFVRVRVNTSPTGILGKVVNIKEDADNRDPKWQDGGDGFLYYAEALAQDGAKSGVVMKQLEYLGGEDYSGDFEIFVYQESVVATVGAGEAASLDAMKAAFNLAGQPTPVSP